MTEHRAPWSWGATEAEWREPHPAAHLLPDGSRTALRAISVRADAATVFRWVCQLKVAPYSYDWLDNLGRTSPRQLTPAADRLAVGQTLMISRIVDFEPGHYVTGVSTKWSDRVFGGPMVLTYTVHDCGPEQSRLVCHLAISAVSRRAQLAREVLAWGDLVMMRKQLLTLKQLAETPSATTTGLLT